MSDQDAKKATKPYTAPKLTVVGPLYAVTQAAKTFGNTDGFGFNPGSITNTSP